MATRATVVKGAGPGLGRAAFVAELARVGSPVPAEAAGRVYDYAAGRGLDCRFLLGVFGEESSCGTNPDAICVGGGGVPEPTYSWGNTTQDATKPSYGHPGTGRVVRGRFSVYPGWYEGGISTVARFFDHAPYAGLATVAELIRIWAPPDDGNRTEEYIAGVVATMTRLEGAGMATPREVTDRMIATLKARGVAVYDLRGRLPVNASASRRYGLVAGGLAGVKKLIQHWTGDAFSRATLRTITGTDYGGDAISAAMTVEDEIDLLTWYATYHIGRDGGTWGGIAYGLMVMPSGRVYVNWDIGTLTYHAFNANADSYALCCPASNGQGPTPGQLVALNHVWQVLCEGTPEIAAGWGDLWGHTEARRFDARNQTSCPGPGLLAHVQRARAGGAPSVDLGAAVAPMPPSEGAAPPSPPSAVRVQVPGVGEYWIIEPILSHYRANGALARYGWPLSGLYTETEGEARGLAVQWFERARLEVQPDGTVTEGRLGAELLAARGWAA